MLKIRNYNHYDLNPPREEPIPFEDSYISDEEYYESLIDEHLYEEKYSLDFVDYNEMRDEWLIEMSQFKQNYNGILTHDGAIKVAKSETKVTFLHENGDTVLLRGKGKSFCAEIHKELKPLLYYLEKGDTAFIKWRNGKCYIVGFKKKPKVKKIDKFQKICGGYTE